MYLFSQAGKDRSMLCLHICVVYSDSFSSPIGFKENLEAAGCTEDNSENNILAPNLFVFLVLHLLLDTMFKRRVEANIFLDLAGLSLNAGTFPPMNQIKAWIRASSRYMA